VVLGLASVLFTVGYFRPSEYFFTSDDYFLNRFFTNRTLTGVRDEFSRDYDQYSEDYLILPVWVKKRPVVYKEKFSSSELRIDAIKEKSAVLWEANTEGEDGGLVEISNYYFPGWEVRVDGNLVEPEILAPYGNMGVRVGGGRHELALAWQETGLRKVADGVSLTSMGLMLGLFFLKRRKSEKN